MAADTIGVESIDDLTGLSLAVNPPTPETAAAAGTGTTEAATTATEAAGVDDATADGTATVAADGTGPTEVLKTGAGVAWTVGT